MKDMNNKHELRAGIWFRAFAIAIASPIICVWGFVTAGMVIFAVLWLIGVILDVDYFNKIKEENKRKSDENYAKLLEKLNKCK